MEILYIDCEIFYCYLEKTSWKKAFVNTFIESIELYPDKKRKDGCAIKNIKCKFKVSYNGEHIYEILSPLATTDETVVLMTKIK